MSDESSEVSKKPDGSNGLPYYLMGAKDQGKGDEMMPEFVADEAEKIGKPRYAVFSDFKFKFDPDKKVYLVNTLSLKQNPNREKEGLKLLQEIRQNINAFDLDFD